MNPLRLLNNLGWLLFVGGVIALVGVLNGYDRQVEDLAHQRYCENVALWLFEEHQGIDPLDRTGHPDFDEIAAEHCPGLRPAEPANPSEIPNRSTERQLADQ